MFTISKLKSGDDKDPTKSLRRPSPRLPFLSLDQKWPISHVGVEKLLVVTEGMKPRIFSPVAFFCLDAFIHSGVLAVAERGQTGQTGRGLAGPSATKSSDYGEEGESW